jgi:hypothetical protein
MNDLSMKPGMSREDRTAIRQRIEDELVQAARAQAVRLSRSPRCAAVAPELPRPGGMTGDQAKAEHAKCLAEMSGNGCLCPCHDPDE